VLKSRRRVQLVILCSVHAVNHIYQLALPILTPRIAVDLSLSNFYIGILSACFTIPYAFLQVPFGGLARRFDRRRLLSLGLILNAAAFCGILFTRDLVALAALLFAAGVGGSTYHPLGISLISSLYAERKGQAMGFHQMGGAVGSFIAPFILGTLTSLYDWRTALTLLSPLGGVMALLVFRLDRDAPRDAKEQLGVEDYSSAMLLISTAGIYIVGLRGVTPFATRYFEENRGASSGEAVLLFSMLQVAGIISGPTCGRLSDNFGRKRVITVLILLQAASIALIAATFGAPFYLACILFGFATFGLLATTDAYLTDLTPPSALGTVVGLNLAASFVVGSIVPPVLGGLIDTAGFERAFMLVGAVSLVSLAPLARVNRERAQGLAA
jgi:MFS family permease